MKYKLQVYLKKSIRDPQGAIFYILYRKKGIKRLSIKRLTQHLGIGWKDVCKYHEEILHDIKFNEHITESIAQTGRTNYGQMIGGPELYTVIRAVKPVNIIETGVAAGISSAFILQALENNNKGMLYSIDLPNYEAIYCPKVKKEPSAILSSKIKPGFVIPNKLKKRWVLKIGKSSEVLPKLLRHLNKIDLFLHDSEHTYENMTFEFNSTWNYLSKGGVLLSHDIG